VKDKTNMRGDFGSRPTLNHPSLVNQEEYKWQRLEFKEEKKSDIKA